MKSKYIQSYMATAEIFADHSSAKRLHVGAVIVKDNRIISIGYNGMPSGWDNECEYVEYTYDVRDTHFHNDWKFDQETKQYHRLKTKPEVLHAETNAIAKLAKSTESGDGASMFITHAPCLDCAKLVYQSGINSVYYRNAYRSDAGVKFLEKAGVKVEKV